MNYTTTTNYYKTNAQTRNKILKRFSMFDGVGLNLTGREIVQRRAEYGGA